MTKEAADYNNNPKRRGATMVLAMPGAGGPMLLELMAMAGSTRVTGSQEKSFYQAITILIESMSSNGNVYGNVCDVAKEPEGLKFYARDNKEFDINLTCYEAACLLMKSPSLKGMALTATLRDDGEGWIERFCSAVRFINHNSTSPFRLAFLVADLSEVKFANPAEHNRLLQSYKQAIELGDSWVKKSDLLKNPKQAMMKLGCEMYPDEEQIKRIMKKYEGVI